MSIEQKLMKFKNQSDGLTEKLTSQHSDGIFKKEIELLNFSH